jgi:O-antigen ligase
MGAKYADQTDDVLTSWRAIGGLVLVLAMLGAVTAWSLLVTVPLTLVALRRIRQWDGILVGGVMILAGSALSVLATIDLAVTLRALAGIVGAFAVTVLLQRWWVSAARLRSGLIVYVGIVAVLVLLATIQVDIQFAKLNAMSQAVYGWFGHWPHLDNVGFSQNATAALIVAVCPFSLTMAFGKARMPLRLAAGAVSLWFVFALILTLSRGAYFGLAFGMGAMLWLNGGRTRWLAPAPALLTLVLLLAGVTGYEFTLSATPTGWSSVDRLYIWHTALRVLADFPLTGPGAGTFPLRVPAYTWPMEARDIPHAHNFVLQTYLDSGLLGLTGMLVLVLGVLSGLRRLVSVPMDGRLRLALLGSAGAIVGSLSHGFVDAYFWGDARTFYVIAFPIAVLVSVARLRGISLAFPESATLTTQLARWGGALRRAAAGLRWRSPRGVAAGLAALTAAFVLGRPIASLALANSGNMLREHGDLMPTGSSSQTVTYAVAHVQLAWSAGLEQGYGAAWQDLAEVALDERDASQAALYLARAAQEGQRDALVLRDDDRLSRLAIAQASPNLHAPH